MSAESKPLAAARLEEIDTLMREERVLNGKDTADLRQHITSLTAQLAEARKDGSPHWTSEKPTTPGYYWVRHTNVKDDKRLWYLYSNDILDYNWQFAGPIPVPLEGDSARKTSP